MEAWHRLSSHPSFLPKQDLSIRIEVCETDYFLRFRLCRAEKCDTSCHQKRNQTYLDTTLSHKYENPKSKNNKVSKWVVEECPFKDLVKKEMVNESIDKKYRMIHVLYESVNNKLEDYIDDIVKFETNKII